MTEAAAALERAYRDERAVVLATITRRLGGDLETAEDVVHDAVLSAAVDWDRGGVPDRPGAWLTTTAWRKALDRIRRDRALAARLPALLEPESYRDPDPEEESVLIDDRLAMMFACCHPALPVDARLALTLRSVGGLTVPEIARAFLTTDATMEQRLVRARRKVATAGIPFRVPPDDLLAERLAGVLLVVCLVYTEGHGGPRADLRAEAIRLARLLARLMPDQPETAGLLALLLLTEARRPARGTSLEDADRSGWDRALLVEGAAVLTPVLRTPGPYVLRAAIAAVHAQAPAFGATDWPRIVELYDALARLDPSPVVAVNRAVAVGFATGWDAGLALLGELAADPRLDRYQPLHAARADLLRRAGSPAATAAYDRAIELTADEADRAALVLRRSATLPLPRSR